MYKQLQTWGIRSKIAPKHPQFVLTNPQFIPVFQHLVPNTLEHWSWDQMSRLLTASCHIVQTAHHAQGHMLQWKVKQATLEGHVRETSMQKLTD